MLFKPPRLSVAPLPHPKENLLLFPLRKIKNLPTTTETEGEEKPKPAPDGGGGKVGTESLERLGWRRFTDLRGNSPVYTAEKGLNG